MTSSTFPRLMRGFVFYNTYDKIGRPGLVVKWKHWSLQNSYAGVRFPPRPQGEYTKPFNDYRNTPWLRDWFCHR